MNSYQKLKRMYEIAYKGLWEIATTGTNMESVLKSPERAKQALTQIEDIKNGKEN